MLDVLANPRGLDSPTSGRCRAGLPPSGAQRAGRRGHQRRLTAFAQRLGRFPRFICSAVAAGTWGALPPLPVPLGETAAGILINPKNGANWLVVVGEGNGGTFLYNTYTGQWKQGVPRPYAGHHIAAEVINNRLYLFGGLNAGGNKIQIYDLATDSWSFGHDLPYAVGSAATAHIGAYVYLCGGILQSIDDTTDACIRYNTVTNKWEGGIASMPHGVNHAAAGTDGKLMYVAGGRDGRNQVGNGFNYLQIYNPATNSWRLGKALPEGRGGTGKAVVLGRKMYVMGGETRKSGPDGQIKLSGQRTYYRVDVYDLDRNKWTQDANMPAPRHGIFPVADRQGNIFVAGGGEKAGYGQSAVNSYFRP
ncbi:hypothetical protein COHA_000225 [Chlorella ohadii]|uniref:Attractin/MKLN-like beta-propeller domain-containing protein n=1 Tax=Chlorella ohadii TaxID=2649997 RepID=A0AAD5H9N3_9CHLO|nr:hypothetical protein COHA_000225 [Chlorella ohadii]